MEIVLSNSEFLPVSVSIFSSALAFFDVMSLVKESVVVKSFLQWKENYSKSYESEHVEQAHFNAWVHNLQKVKSYNKHHVTSLATMNQFADETTQEFSKRNGLKKVSHKRTTRKVFRTYVDVTTLPKEVDWRKKGVVNPIKNQAQCGSCWAFSAVTALETQYAIKNKKLISLSEQDLVDCMVNFQTPNGPCCDGCGGGWMGPSYDFLKQKQNGTDDLEDKYVYTATDGTCDFQLDGPGTGNITGKVTLPQGSDAHLMKAVAEVGVISVGVDANFEWQVYESGVYIPDPQNGGCSSSPEQIDHGVAVVGYGSDTIVQDGKNKTLNFWIVRNSWAESWGENGYMRLSRDVDNACGISNYATYPLLDE